MDLVLLFMQLLAAQYCPLPTHRRVEAIANRQPPRPSLGGVRQIDHVAMCGSERSLRSYTIFACTPPCVDSMNTLLILADRHNAHNIGLRHYAHNIGLRHYAHIVTLRYVYIIMWLNTRMPEIGRRTQCRSQFCTTNTSVLLFNTILACNLHFHRWNAISAICVHIKKTVNKL